MLFLLSFPLQFFAGAADNLEDLVDGVERNEALT
jgi:hypothetical protein